MLLLFVEAQFQQIELLFYYFLQIELKTKLACHPARCLLPVEIIERCG